ncbi:transcription factor Adf-1-like [Corythoichthys intestinalis]|uniref:transcription factor Adf-1-like n=1 Tax=Corythoichthys intestinalis TaxID=161448 RepID=UPI0025A57DE1|nr:transcription factor Adf-1-like [Corythoichthys intestinalis]
MADELLLEEVRKYRHLYDSDHSSYRDYRLNKNSWRKIALKLGRNEDTLRKCWKNLRDRYVKATKVAKRKRGDQGARNMPAILKEMDWLSPFIKRREKPDMPAAEELDVEHLESFQLPLSPSLASSPSSCSSEISFTMCNSPSPSKERTSTKDTLGPEPKRTMLTEDVILQRLERIDKERKSRNENADVRFGFVIADMLATLTPRKKEAVKFKIYQLLYEARESAIEF